MVRRLKALYARELIYILFLTIIPIFLPSLWSDDYAAIINPELFSNSLISDLRPIWALSSQLTFDWLSKETFAWVPRILSSICLFLIYLNLIGLVNPDKLSFKIRTIFLITLSLPSISIFIHWLVFWQNAYALLFSIIALRLCLQNSSFLSLVFSGFLFSISLLIYPPSAFASFALIALCIRFSWIKESSITSVFLKLLTVTVVSSFGALMISKQIGNLLGVTPSSRVTFTTIDQYSDKLIYLSKMFILPFNLASITRPSTFPYLVITVTLMSIFFISHLKLIFLFGKEGCVRIVQLMSLLVVSMFPIVVTADNQIEYRLIAGLSIYCTFTVLLSVITFAEDTLNKLMFLIRKDRILLSVEGLIVIPLILSLLLCNVRYLNFFHYHSTKAQHFVQKSLLECSNLGKYDSVVLVPIAESQQYQRIGVYSMKTDFASDWVPVNAFNYYNSLLAKPYKFTFSTEMKTLTPTTCLIELQDIEKIMKKTWIW